MSTEWWIRIIVGVIIMMFIGYAFLKKHLAEFETLKENNKLLKDKV